MAAPHPNTANRLRSIIQTSENPKGASVVALLAWLASIDGEMVADEQAAIREACAEIIPAGLTHQVLNSFAAFDSTDIQLAAEVIQGLSVAEKKLVLELGVVVALADNRLVTTENHGLRFLADLVGLGESGLSSVFRKFTDVDMPRPGDPSTLDWWTTREQSKSGTSQSETNQGKDFEEPNSRFGRLRDLALLGLDETAEDEDIKRAYRRMAMLHHPDRYTSLGKAAVDDATATFHRIQGAYERLVDK